MFKNEIKGHGAIKKLRTGAVVSVLTLSAVGAGGVVNADEVTTSESIVRSVPTEDGYVATTEPYNISDSTDGVDLVASTEPIDGIDLVAPTELIRVEDTTVTQGQVEQAQSDSVTATNDVRDQEVVVSDINNQITETQDVIDSTKEEITEVEAVTPEVVADAQDKADTANTALTQANQTVTSAEDTVKVADDKVATQQGVVDGAKADVADTGAAVADAKDKVDALSTTTDTNTLKDNVSKLEGTVATDQTNLKNAQDTLDAAKLAQTNKAQAIADQEGVVKNAEGVVDAAASDYAGAIIKQQGTQTTEDQAKSALDTAKKGTVVTSQVKVGDINALTADSATLKSGVAVSGAFGDNGVLTSDEYLTALKNLANGTGTVQDVTNAISNGYWGNSLATVAAPSTGMFDSWANQLNYSFSNTDTTTKVSVHDLSDAQLTDLSLFYTALVNDLRSKVGSPLLSVTQASVDQAKDNVRQIFNTVFGSYDNMTYDQLKSAGFFNSMSDLDKTGKPLKVSSTTQDGVKTAVSGGETIIGQYPAAPNSSTFDDMTLTMADLKLRILASLGNQLYSTIGEANGGVNGTRGTNYDAALTVLGLKGNYTTAALDFDYTLVNQAVVTKAPLQFTTLGNAVGTPIDNPYLTLVNPKVTATPVYKTVSEIVVDADAVAKAQSDYDAAVQANNSAKGQLSNLETAYTQAQANLLKAQKALTDLKNGTVDIPALEQAVKDAEAKLASDSEALQKAKENLALAEASAADKAKALELAKSELADAIAADTLAKGVLAKEQDTLTQLTNQANAARVALSDAKTKQVTAQTAFNTADAKAKDLATKLANKDVVLAELNSKLAEATSKAATLRAELETAEELLANLKLTANEKMDEFLRLATLKAEQDEAEAEVQRLAELKAKADAIANAGGYPIQVVKDGVVVDILDASKLVKNGHGVTYEGIDYLVNEDGTLSIVVAEEQGGAVTNVVKQAGVTQVGDKITYSRVERAKALPNTGSQESLLGLLGASMLLGLGYTGKRRRKN